VNLGGNGARFHQLARREVGLSQRLAMPDILMEKLQRKEALGFW